MHVMQTLSRQLHLGSSPIIVKPRGLGKPRFDTQGTELFKRAYQLFRWNRPVSVRPNTTLSLLTTTAQEHHPSLVSSTRWASFAGSSLSSSSF